MKNDGIERQFPALFCPTEASESSGYYPVDWPWEDKPRELDVAFKIGLGDPAIKQYFLGGAPVNVGEKHWIGMQGYNYGPYTLYKMESDLYVWNKDTQEYFFSEAEDDETRLAAWEAVVELWANALTAEYDAMLAEADRAEKALIEAEKTAFEAQLMARRAALAFEIPDPAQVDEEIAELLMQKTSELCYERHTAPEPRTDLRATVSGALLDAGEDLRCGQFTHEIGTTLLVTKTLCPEHRAIDAIADDANNAEGWKQVKQAWLDALNAETDARYLAADEAGREIIAAEREAYGEWLEARGALLNRLYPDQPAVVQEVLAETIRARVLEECGD